MHTLIIPMYYPEKDSAPHRGYMFTEQATELAKAGHKVGLLFVEQRPLSRFSFNRFFKESHYQISETKEKGFTTMRMHAWNSKLSTRLGAMIWVLLTVILVRHYIKRHGKPDIVHAHFSLYAGYAASIISRLYKIPYAVTEHASSIGNKDVPQKHKSIIKKAYNKSSAVIAVGDNLAKSIKDLKLIDDVNKLTVIPNLIDTNEFVKKRHTTDKVKQFKFVSVGNLLERKGFIELIEGFDLAFGDRENVSLTIIGEGEQRQQLEKKISQLRSKNRITLYGKASRKEITEMLSEYDAFALASRAETFGMVYVEALSAGLPILATDCGVPQNVVNSICGVMVPNTRDKYTIGEGLQKIYDEHEKYDARQISEYAHLHFDISKTATYLNEVYKKVLGA